MIDSLNFALIWEAVSPMRIFKDFPFDPIWLTYHMKHDGHFYENPFQISSQSDEIEDISNLACLSFACVDLKNNWWLNSVI